MELNLVTLMDQFGTEDECRAYLTELRWPEDVACPRCGDMKHQYDSKSHQYDCSGCGYKFTVTTGTMLHDTHLPLRKWLIAVFLICEAKKGISSNQLKRTIGVAHKTGWYLTSRIRSALTQAQANHAPLTGIVEVDETYIGGKVRGKGRGYRDNKTMILGAVERGGNVYFEVAERANRKTLHGFIHENVADEAEAIYTDEHPAYKGIADENTRHETVNHSAEEWVRGPVHTNTIEGNWSLFDRGVIGSYHQLSRKHLQSYADEFSWRANNRDNPYLFRDTLKALLNAEQLEYKELIAD